jgi:putative membrane-bound dehydrogenase-like protein
MNIKKLSLFVTLLVVACNTAPKEKPLVVKEDPAKAAANAKLILENTPVQLAEGLKISLWASDSLAPDPIALSIDDLGKVYLTSTERQKNSEFDIRGHRDWMIPSISFQSVEDRRAFLRKTFAPERSKENEWLADLNHDSIHDWHDLAVEKDEVWRLEDLNGDGMADISTRIVSDFNEEITDVAEGLLVREKDMFVAIGPDLWRLQDLDGDGIPEKKESISHGYAVHIGFGGHGMSGIVEGPDGKIYWGIGDIGANIVDKAGNKHFYPNEGIIVRSNPDGTDFEVFAAGLRNTYEFTFDEYGNLITSDNDGDHPGESERLVHIVEGTDLGWRANWQYGKYVDPKNNRYNVWMDERLSIPRWEGQAAHILPPIVNYHNGPTGMVYNPGTALGTKWKNRFFLVEFVGTPSRSHIWSFTLKPKGASFDLNEEIDMLNGILPTGIQFGPDGAMYVADWINGWGTKNYGRVWKLDVDGANNDLEKERKDTEWNMKLNYADVKDETLGDLLSHDDMRIRKKAQFELAKRDKAGDAVFKQAIAQRENQLARVHSIWGVGQLAEKDIQYANQLIDLLNDTDSEIVAQAAKVLGDRRHAAAGEKLVTLLDATPNPRVKFFAAQALGRMKFKPAVPSLIKMIDANNDEDLYIRHVGVIALSRIGELDPIVALTKSSERDLRIASALVLRRMKSEKISLLLTDQEEYIVTEAARAINDDLSIVKSLPDLAAVIQEKRFKTEPLLRRAINACLRVGGEKELDMLIAFARRTDVSEVLRAEALAALGTWADLSLLDRVDGVYRGEVKRDPTSVKQKVSLVAKEFLQDKNIKVVMAAGEMLANLSMPEFNATLASLARSSGSEEVRASVIKNLNMLKFDDMTGLIKTGMNDKSERVRAVAISLLGELTISKETLPDLVKPIFAKGGLSEQQALIKVLGKMPLEKSEPVLVNVIDLLKSGKLTDGIRLELTDAVEATQSAKLKEQLASLPKVNSLLDEYAGTLLGGNGGSGYGIFFYNSTAQCVRCHAIDGNGGKVGPDLTNVGNILTREQILEAMVDPSARLSPGFGTVKVTLTDGSEATGTLMEENAKEIILKTSDAEPLEIELSRVAKRNNYPSGMPPMGKAMSKKEIRDLVEFLANRKSK